MFRFFYFFNDKFWEGENNGFLLGKLCLDRFFVWNRLTGISDEYLVIVSFLG